MEDYTTTLCGKIVSKKNRKTRILKPTLNRDGYQMVVLMISGKRHYKSVHRLIAESFISNPENKPTVNHKNGVKTDNRVSNLEWCTQSENVRHAVDTGLKVSSKGEKHGSSKLTEYQVLLIKADNRTQKEIALDYGVHQQQISRIKNNKLWKHL